MSQTILLVEDSRLVQELYRQKFTVERFRILIAGDGLEALRILAKETPDLILLDLVLPGIDGYQILEVAKREPRLRDVPVIVFSGKSQGTEVQRALDLGATDFIVKATTPPAEVVQRIRQILRERKVPHCQYRLRLDPTLFDAPRLADALGIPNLSCNACGAALAVVLASDGGHGWQCQVACSGCGKAYPDQVAQRPVVNR